MRIVVVGGTVLLGTNLTEDGREALPPTADMLTEDAGVVIEVPDSPSAENAAALELFARTPPADGALSQLMDEPQATTPAHRAADIAAPDQFGMGAFYRTALAAQADWV
ncbi:hypothetical protein HUT06_07735 [Actinomadura sp. NAK00032]|uniref:hypothetical protein n=1 Tax=Actinomadura sp. NAK00032 TaxID=2742128 RepID=UPI0015917957|nr:hypothetical protein [Actinomadura sp. NAK00032]QKW33935.1 hypothetical protein HUT06_07735 [Actinomadura sp. NAK00032]